MDDYEKIGCGVVAIIAIFMAILFFFSVRAEYRMCATHFPDEKWDCFFSGSYQVREVGP